MAPEKDLRIPATPQALIRAILRKPKPEPKDRAKDCPRAHLTSIWIPIVLALLVSACGGGDGGGGEPLTIEEYAAATCDSDAEDEEDLTWGQSISLFKSLLKEMNRIKPPSELRDYHQANLAIVQVVIEFAEKQDKDDIVNPYLFLTEQPIFLLGMTLSSLENELPDSIRKC